MAMGTAFFTDDNLDPVDFNKYKYMKEFDNMLYEFNNRFGVKGCPMRFTATGETVTNW